ncbi:MAG: hypothetical protein IPP17_03390 [Bacteroidetes bacterium]|nr:hypothetical protein [Bacteroidota bacterium]
MQRWFSEREKEIGTTIKADTGMEFGYGVTKGNVLQSLFGIVAYVRAGLSGSKQWVNTIRTSFKIDSLILLHGSMISLRRQI